MENIGDSEFLLLVSSAKPCEEVAEIRGLRPDGLAHYRFFHQILSGLFLILNTFYCRLSRVVRY